MHRSSFASSTAEHDSARIVHHVTTTPSHQIASSCSPKQDTGALDIVLFARCKETFNSLYIYIGFNIDGPSGLSSPRKTHDELSWSADAAYIMSCEELYYDDFPLFNVQSGHNTGHSEQEPTSEIGWLSKEEFCEDVAEMRLRLSIEYELRRYPLFADATEDTDVEVAFEDGYVMHLNGEQLRFFRIDIGLLAQEQHTDDREEAGTACVVCGPVTKYVVTQYSSKGVLNFLHILLFNKPIPYAVADVHEVLAIAGCLGSKVVRSRVERAFTSTLRPKYAIATGLLLAEAEKLPRVRWDSKVAVADDQAPFITDSRYLQKKYVEKCLSSFDRVCSSVLDRLMEKKLPPAEDIQDPLFFFAPYSFFIPNIPSSNPISYFVPFVGFWIISAINKVVLSK